MKKKEFKRKGIYQDALGAYKENMKNLENDQTKNRQQLLHCIKNIQDDDRNISKQQDK